MVKSHVVGYRFSPTDEELIKHYLKNKILEKHWLVDEAISEINICSYKPKSLPPLARIQSDDPVWYFFAPKEYTSPSKKVIKRSTDYGFWKPTGKDRIIIDKRGKGVPIGSKKTLVYHQGKTPNEIWTPWVIHEYHITCVPQDQRNYVICQVMYKGEEGHILYGNNLIEPSPSLVSDSNTVREMYTAAPEVEQAGQEGYYGLSANDLLNPLNKQEEDLSLSDVFNPNTFNNLGFQQQTPYGGDHLRIPMNIQEDLYQSDGFNPNTLLRDHSPHVQQHTPPYGGDLRIPMNEQENLSQPLGVDGFIPNTSFSDNNNNNYYPNLQPQTPSGDDYLSDFLCYNGGNFGDVCSDLDLIMQENRNDYRPKKAMSGFIVDCSSDSDSDSDAESISATSYQGRLSPAGDSVGSSNRHFPSSSSTDSCKDLQTSADPLISTKTQLTRRTIPSKQEVKQDTSRAVDTSMARESFMVKTEKKGLFIIEEAMEKNQKKPQYIYLMNMIIGFILLLAFIGNMVSVFVKTLTR